MLSISYKHEPFYKLLQEDILTRVYGSHHFGRYQVAAHPVTRYYCYGAGYLLYHRDVLFYPIVWTLGMGRKALGGVQQLCVSC